ncbi:hypothetical protein FBF75_06435 [Bacillus sp. S2(2019)]|nr:hypothetical protein CFN77_16050 [Bacillus altitudinis]MBW3699116.1 hypothetical protein [Bacillus aerophilus]RFB48996.1 hypothetical protein DZB74_01300 [Bacillus sp. HMG]TFW49101.1 hypothetical protein ES896_01420 [Bacillus sp. 005/A4HT-01/001]TKD58197.1 hypothetical protein FBF75_06435 [Bacillus sp. S2(2019)]TYO53831.1 hypothetical protein FXF70_01310 [Bacillus sp. Y3]HCO78897.1 hypothetical protein [Bacillus sp. (in: firmicutes)]
MGEMESLIMRKKASAPKCRESSNFLYAGSALNKCRTATSLKRGGLSGDQGVCFEKHGLLFRLFFMF